MSGTQFPGGFTAVAAARNDILLADNGSANVEVTVGSVLGQILLSDLPASGATSGQVLGWNGSAWVPITISSGSGGTNGTNGTSFLAGTGNPASGLGNTGDTYLNESNGELWSKATGSWVDTGTTLHGVAGVAGPIGPAGPTGAAGTGWLYGNSAPAAGLGVANDLYLVLTTGEIWTNNAGTWTDTGVTLKGATGPQGPTGSGSGASETVSTYTAAGALSVTDNVSYVVNNSGATMAMTLASPTANSGRVDIVQAGSGPISVAATIAGIAQTITISTTGTLNGTLSLRGNAARNSWYMV
jgi:hypothetical protein